MTTKSTIRLNIGCGGRPLPGYTNVDSDNLEKLKARYPGQSFPEGVEVYDYDIFKLPFADGTVAEVRADSLIEHLSFEEEPRFFYEAKRVLEPGGLLDLSTPDFEGVAKLWLAAKDDWKDFYRNDAEAIAKEHWFGQYSYAQDNRWGYLTVMMFGSQNGDGQYHKNCYTQGKLEKMMERLGFSKPEVRRFLWKGDRDPMIQIQSRKL